MSKAIQFRNRNNEKVYPCPYYPVGSIYIATNSTNPSTYFGGTWERIKGKFLLSADDSTYKLGATGGAATHTLTTAEMPSHNHQPTKENGFLVYRTSYPSRVKVATSSTGRYTFLGKSDATSADDSGLNYGSIGTTGGGKAHNNMPPYLVVYVWKRVS